MNPVAQHRRGVQIERTLKVIDLLRDRPSVSLMELRKLITPRVCERTLRRDLMILMRMGWLTPIDDGRGGTRWRWTKDE